MTRKENLYTQLLLIHILEHCKILCLLITVNKILNMVSNILLEHISKTRSLYLYVHL